MTEIIRLSDRRRPPKEPPPGGPVRPDDWRLHLMRDALIAVVNADSIMVAQHIAALAILESGEP
jgi:hypothetical protein